MLASCASHSRVAPPSATVSSTGWMSVGELLITRRISAVAVCCSRASARTGVLGLQLTEQPRILHRDHGLVGRRSWSKRDLGGREAAHAVPVDPDDPHDLAPPQHRHRDDGPEAPQPGVVAKPLAPGRIGVHVDHVLDGTGQDRPAWRIALGRRARAPRAAP